MVIHNAFEDPKSKHYTPAYQRQRPSFPTPCDPFRLHKLVVAIGDLAHLAKSRLRSLKAVLQLEDLDLIQTRKHLSKGSVPKWEKRTCCSISLILNSCPLKLA